MSQNLTGKQIRGYEFREQLGQGGCGVVYRAYQPSLDREVAVKFLLPELCQDTDFIQGFQSEARLIAKLEHPYIVPLFEYWYENDSAGIVMRCYNGGNLRKLIADKGKLPLDRIAKIIDQVSAALAAAHHFGIVHRDIKPENILLDDENNAFLSDFGIAQHEGTLTETPTFSGTLQYAAPEQLQGFPPIPQMDTYSLGIVLYEMITGVQPLAQLQFHEIVDWHFYSNLPRITELSPENIEKINDIIQRATMKDPQKRYQDIYEIAVDFRQALDIKVYHAVTEEVNSVNLDDSQSIIGEHLDYLYKRLDELYELRKESNSPETDADLQQRIERLKQDLQYRNAGLKVVEKQIKFEPPIALRPPSTPQHKLIGHEEKLKTLTNRVLSGKSTTLIGASGIGKSELAAAVARDPMIQKHFEGRVIWFQLGKSPDLFTLLGEWLTALNVSADDLKNLTNLEERNKRLQALVGTEPTLVLVDDIWKADHLKNSVFDTRNEFVYVLTTVSAEVASDFVWDSIPVVPLSMEDRIALLQAIVGFTKADDPNTQQLVERIGGLPRDIVLLGTRLRKAGTSTSRLTREIEKVIRQPLDVLQQGYASLAMSIEELSEDARRALWCIAQLPPAPNTISESAGEKICEDLGFLDELIDYSLLRLEDNRYELHPSFAEYAKAKLTPDDGVYRRIVDYYFDYLKERDNDSLSIEYRNLEASLDIATIHKFNAEFVTAVIGLASFWEARGMIEQADRYLQQAHALASGKQSAELNLKRARLEYVRGNLEQSAQFVEAGEKALATEADKPLTLALAIQKGDIKRAEGKADEAKAIWSDVLSQAQQLNDQDTMSATFNSLGTIEVVEFGNPESAKDYFLKSLESGRLANIPARLTRALQNIGLLETLFYRNFEQATSYLAESLQIARQTGHAEEISAALQSRGMVELNQNNFDQARMYYEEALQKARAAQSVEAIAWGALTLANVLISLDEFAPAEEYLGESLKNARIMDHPVLISSIADVVIKCGETRIASQKFNGVKLELWENTLAAAKETNYDAEKFAWLQDVAQRLQDFSKDTGTKSEAETRPAISLAQYNLGRLEGDQFHDFDLAKSHFSSSLKLAQIDNNTPLILKTLMSLSHVHTQLTEFEAAESTLEQAVGYTATDDKTPLIKQLIEIGEARLAAKANSINESLWSKLIEAAPSATEKDQLKELLDQLKEISSTQSE